MEWMNLVYYGLLSVYVLVGVMIFEDNTYKNVKDVIIGLFVSILWPIWFLVVFIYLMKEL